MISYDTFHRKKRSSVLPTFKHSMEINIIIWCYMTSGDIIWYMVHIISYDIILYNWYNIISYDIIWQDKVSLWLYWISTILSKYYIILYHMMPLYNIISQAICRWPPHPLPAGARPSPPARTQRSSPTSPNRASSSAPAPNACTQRA